MKALRSFFTNTAEGLAIVVDDGSDKFNEQEIAASPLFKGQEVVIHRFEKWGGLTRSWNKGIEIAAMRGVDYVCPGNNDIIFTEGWYEGMLHALSNGYQLAGPVSNAPGVTAKGKAEVWRYVKDYHTTDEIQYLNQVSRMLRDKYMGSIVEAHVNGFFQMGKLATFEAGRYDEDHYYKPSNDRSSQGRKNPTPLMTLNEDELQGRWKRQGWKFAVAISSFVFHYRAVTRGNKYLRGRWLRMIGDE